MKLFKTLVAGLATALALQVATANAQEQRPNRDAGGGRGDRGGFDPEQMRVRMMERYRESLEIKSDDEWKAIEPLIQKVSDARRATMSGFGGFGRGGGPGGPGGTGGRRGFGGESSPEAEALQKAIEAKAPNDEIKTKLAKYRESVKTRQAALTAAQDELKKVLTTRQEASAVMMGLLQ